MSQAVEEKIGNKKNRKEAKICSFSYPQGQINEKDFAAKIIEIEMIVTVSFRHFIVLDDWSLSNLDIVQRILNSLLFGQTE